jgi:hypothetical protein
MAAALRRSVNQRRRWLEEKVTETNHKKKRTKERLSSIRVFWAASWFSNGTTVFFYVPNLGLV